MIPLGGGEVLRNWMSPAAPTELMSREPGREWYARPGETYSRSDFLDDLQALLDQLYVKVDLLGRRIEVRLGAADVSHTWIRTAADGGSYVMGPAWRGATSLDGDPLFSITFDEIGEAMALVCDPDGLHDADGDTSPENDCPLGRAAVLGVSCPLIGGCDPLAAVAPYLEQVDEVFSTLVLRFEGGNAGVNGCAPRGGLPGGGWRWPATMDIDYRVSVEASLEDEIYGASSSDVDFTWTYVDADLSLPFSADDLRCVGGCGGAGSASPWVTWSDFAPVPGGSAPFDAWWEARNLRMEPPLAPASSSRPNETDVAIDLTSLGHDVLGGWAPDTRREFEAQLREARIMLEVAADELVAAVNRFVYQYLSLLPDEGGMTLSSTLVKIAFDAMEGGPTPKEQALRMIEGSAGATRYWWNALAGALEAMDAATGGASHFEFTDAACLVPWSGGSGRPFAFDVVSDTDCDGAEDHEDGCPTVCSDASWPDADDDGLADVCDMCPRMAREESGLPRNAPEYDGNPFTAEYRPSANDTDGDGIADRCDLCVAMPHDRSVEDERELEHAWIPFEGDGRTRSWGGPDADGDGIGDRCDNCYVHPNRDQANCNAADEVLRGSLADPPVPGMVGVGDACDRLPCVDRCADPDLFARRHSEYEDDAVIHTTDDPITARMCAVGGINAYHEPGVSARTFDTRTRVCDCPPNAEGPAEPCLDTRCRSGGVESPGWQRIEYPTCVRGADGLCVDPPYSYRPLYWRWSSPGMGDPGLMGRRGDLRGYHAFWNGDDRTLTRVETQPWYWKTPVCGNPEGCNRWLRVWFRPQPNAEVAWFSTGFDRDVYGNTYTDPWFRVERDTRIDFAPGSASEWSRFPNVGTATKTDKWVLGDNGDMRRSHAVLADILEATVCRVMSPCPWPDWYFFEPRGQRVGGLLVSAWDKSVNDLGWTIGTKVSGAAPFDLLDPGIAFSFDPRGLPSRYWTFGGVDTADLPSAQMWGARRMEQLPGGQLASFDDAAVEPEPVGSAFPTGETSWFALSEVPRSNVWPPARSAPVLACAGFEKADGGGCDRLCPKVGVALGENPPPDGIVQPAGRLLLVGGRGEAGLLDDIWAYDEQATMTRTDPAQAGDGPWPSGWRPLGTLPDTGGGLVSPGVAQVRDELHLFGGLTPGGPTNALWRISLADGRAARITPAGPTPAPRVSPALAFDVPGNRLLVFGGTDAAGNGLTDLWGVPLGGGEWKRLAGSCSGNGCPVVTGRETLYYHPAERTVTVIADRGGPAASEMSWTLESGVWRTQRERQAPAGSIDCDGDGVPERLVGLRCSTGTGGFPDFGRLSCGPEGRPACRPPVAPGGIAARERLHPPPRGMASWEGRLLVLHDRTVEVRAISPAGAVSLERRIGIDRPGNDLAVAGDLLLVADERGLAVHRLPEGTRAGRVDTCGPAQRVFADGARAYVVASRSILAVDLRDPAAPVVTDRVRVRPLRDRLELAVEAPAAACSWVGRGLDLLSSWFTPCGASGRAVAAYDEGRIYLHALGLFYVIDFRGPDPIARAALTVGPVSGIEAEAGFVYLNRVGNRTAVVAEIATGVWGLVGEHDVREWVDGVTECGAWAVRWDRGELRVAERQ